MAAQSPLDRMSCTSRAASILPSAYRLSSSMHVLGARFAIPPMIPDPPPIMVWSVKSPDPPKQRNVLLLALPLLILAILVLLCVARWAVATRLSLPVFPQVNLHPTILGCLLRAMMVSESRSSPEAATG
ncbi:hypothetical protein H113_01263 [Trichophyton rubrum MR1459]|uniref:Uncharacterized protein n=1 Tax=Trichophyton rubrum (strain ATCC MYA-4607 / CBS 118892) TaxID=559305 RepID=A0A080WJA8_TRIRC|nr:uncharacterized protein TERG_12580 [Trichophyton rubrum CBS 118892]EZF99024.1 hypothetical protein H113_01263 [Trichophyton rubrum MR1459]EZG10083.1 hypothetical protein H106_01060 [Trichophyton rubrum CBS 735.88]KFL62801.1 hypothetical protein TERG_12580 [Trichophyton rubrum CBS 118892]